jgi:DNA-binding protein
VTTLNPIVVTPEREPSGARDLSQDIIQALTKPEIIDVVGIGTSISGAVAGVNLSKIIANVNIQSVTLDYIPTTATGNQEAIFFELSREKAEVPPTVAEFEKKDEPSKMQQTIWVSREDRIEAVTSLILWKFNKFDLLKVVASGFAITMAVKATLQATTSGIAKQPIAVTAITIDSIERKTAEPRTAVTKKVPAIQIYMEKGKETTYPPRHEEVKIKATQSK